MIAQGEGLLQIFGQGRELAEMGGLISRIQIAQTYLVGPARVPVPYCMLREVCRIDGVAYEIGDGENGGGLGPALSHRA